MYLLIGFWGGERRIYSAYKFFLYTFLGSVLMLVAIIFLYQEFGTISIPKLLDNSTILSSSLALACFFIICCQNSNVAFSYMASWCACRSPNRRFCYFSRNTLKIRGYGFIRFNLSLLPDASIFFTPFIYFLSVVAIIYTSFIALVQEDMKLIAYSSVAHMGFVTLGIFSANIQGLHGAVIQMISHGLISAALFFCIGSIYNRFHTKEIAYYGGKFKTSKIINSFFNIYIRLNRFSRTSGFVGEFLTLLAAYSKNTIVVLYLPLELYLLLHMLILYKKVFLGNTNEKFKSKS